MSIEISTIQNDKLRGFAERSDHNRNGQLDKNEVSSFIQLVEDHEEQGRKHYEEEKDGDKPLIGVAAFLGALGIGAEVHVINKESLSHGWKMTKGQRYLKTLQAAGLGALIVGGIAGAGYLIGNAINKKHFQEDYQSLTTEAKELVKDMIA